MKTKTLKVYNRKGNCPKCNVTCGSRHNRSCDYAYTGLPGHKKLTRMYTLDEQKQRIIHVLTSWKELSNIQLHSALFSYRNRHTQRQALKELVHDGKVIKREGYFKLNEG